VADFGRRAIIDIAVKRLIPIILLLLAAAVQAPAAEAPWERPDSIHEFMKIGDRMRVIAHRGFSGRAPENTLVAVSSAIRVGADMVEVDVTLTSDNRVVCIHDETLDRTTNGTGPVRDHSLAELKRLDAGSWFSREFHNARIPTLDEVLDLVRGRILINIEIKPEAVSGGIAQLVVDAVRSRGMTDHVVVSSFEPRALEQVADADGSIVTASLFNEDLHAGMSPLDVVAKASSQGFNLSRKRVDPRVVSICHSNGIPVAVYTVNKGRAMRRMIDLGVHAVFTDHPDRLIRRMVEDRSDAILGGRYPPVEDIVEWQDQSKDPR
jgi:glycerophosphoryl diester phosphodiesterase